MRPESTETAAPVVHYANTGGINLPTALAAFANLDPAVLDEGRPKVVIHLHLTNEAVTAGPFTRSVIRADHGPITVDQLRRFLGDTAGDITIQPVLDPATVAPVDGYEIPLKMRRAMAIRQPASVFPFSPALTANARTDLDHTRRYRPGGPPGQTRPGNLGPFARSEHRTKTHGGCQVRQPDPGTYLFRTPHGWISLVTNQGTLVLGESQFASQIWEAARKADLQEVAPAS